MRRIIALTALLLFGVPGFLTLHAQGVRPQFRPAVLGTGPDSLVNRIKTADLLKKGQKAGAVMFCCRVSKTGEVTWSKTYRRMPDSQVLEEEVDRCLKGLTVHPAIFQHQPAEVLMFGTVIFSITHEVPELRIFLNQDSTEMKNASDFVGPQPVFGGVSKFNGMLYPAEEAPVHLTGIVELALKVDALGNMQEMRVVSEDPVKYQFGEAAELDFRGAKFIPAFRDGDPVECSTLLPVVYSRE